MMYDERYLENEVKEIETVEEAIAILAVYDFSQCGNACNTCPVRMFEHCKGSDCSEVRRKARNFISDRYGSQRGEGRVWLYNHVVCPTLPEVKEEKPCLGTCSTCTLSEEHSSGIRFCKSFGNFVHEDGYCYRFAPSDKMEEQGVN